MARGVTTTFSNTAAAARLRAGAQIRLGARFDVERRIVDNIGFMRDQLMTNILTDLRNLAAQMEADMKADAAWEDQDEETRNRKGRYGPHARDGLYARVVRRGDQITLAAGFEADVRVQRTDGTFTYGGILETWDVYRNNYAIVGPTFEDYEERFLAILPNASSKGAMRRLRKGPRQ